VKPEVEPAPDEPAPLRVGAGFDFADPDSPLAKFYLSTPQVVAVGVVMGVFALASFFPLWHTDVWGHMKYGRWMAEHGRIPDREPFSPWWDGRQPFTQFYTLTQLAMYGAYAAGAWAAGGDELHRMAGGVDALRTLHAGLTAARFAVLIAVFRRLAPDSWGVVFAGLGAVVMLTLSNVSVFRPQTFAELYFAVLLLILTRERIGPAGMAGLPALLVVWANSHGSYVVGLVLPVILLAGRAVDHVRNRGTVVPDAAWRRLALAWAVGLVAVAVLNPYGPDFFRRTVALASHPTLVGGVSEWQPLAFEWKSGWHWVFMASLVVVAATAAAAPTPMPTSSVLLLLAFGLGAAMQTRFVVWWAMLVPWVLVPVWADIAAARKSAADPPPPTLRKTALAVLLGWALFMWTGVAAWLTTGHPQPVADGASAGTTWRLARQLRRPHDPDARWNDDLARVLDAKYPGGRFTGTVMATPMLGDYLMWELSPDIPVTYAHMHLFPPDYWDQLGVVGRGEPGWWEVLDRYRVNLIVVEAEYSAGLIAQLKKTPEWTILVDETGDAAKPNPLNRHLVAVRVVPR
jgi:hypothetical protein